MRKYPRPIGGKKNQGGFTLAELAVVVIVIGILAAIIVPRFTGQGASKSRATALVSFADSSQAIIKSTISQMQLPVTSTGTGAVGDAPSTSPNMIVANKTWVDALIYGVEVPGATAVPVIKTAFRGRYASTGAGTLEPAVTTVTAPTAGATGSYTVQGYPLGLIDTSATLNAAGMGTLSPRQWAFTYARVPDDVALVLINLLEDENAAAAPAAADTTGVVRSTAPAGGLRTVAIVRSMS